MNAGEFIGHLAGLFDGGFPDDSIVLVAADEDSRPLAALMLDKISDLDSIGRLVMRVALAEELPPDTEFIVGLLCTVRDVGVQISWRDWVLAYTGSSACYAVRDGAWACLMPDTECGCEISAGEVVFDAAH